MEHIHITIIGAGPGGYETAVEAASKGIDVTIISDGPVGGTCLNEGCIPTKTFCRNAELLENLRCSPEFGINATEIGFDFQKARQRKEEVVGQLRSGVEFLLKNKHIRLVSGKASLKDSHTVMVSPSDGGETEEVVSDYIIIATGSVPASLPIPGAGLEGVINSTQLLSIDAVPQRLCIIGAGVIGLEFASIFRSFGSEVTVLEYCKDILPRFDTDLAKRLKQSLGKRGIRIETSAQVQEITSCDNILTVNYLKKDKTFSVEADKVLMAVGRKPAVESLNLADAGIAFGPKGIVTDRDMRTNVPNIFAIGDIRGGMMLAHVATFEGKRALNAILADIQAGGIGKGKAEDRIDFGVIPAAVFTYPEAATVGLTEEDCAERGIRCRCLKSFFRANGKAVAMGETDGYCKLIVAAPENGTEFKDGQILGCHLFGAHSSDIVQEIAALMNCNASICDLQSIIHAHPTLTEVLLGAANA
ncbi:MAG: dihydrolipoyl dehydrogenase [Candidatus Cryptobacteroides sp.]